MYAIRMDTEMNRRTNASLREYARLEYGDGHADWILSDARRGPRSTTRQGLGRRLWARLLPRRPAPYHRPVAHKGSPRGRNLPAPTEA